MKQSIPIADKNTLDVVLDKVSNIESTLSNSTEGGGSSSSSGNNVDLSQIIAKLDSMETNLVDINNNSSASNNKLDVLQEKLSNINETISIMSNKLDTLDKQGGIKGVPLNQPSNYSVEVGDECCIVKWADPEDLVINGVSVVQWKKTVLVRKVGSSPMDINDGEIILESTIRDQYKTEGYIDDNMSNGSAEYYYGIFPCSNSDVYTYGAFGSATPTIILPEKVTNVSMTNLDEEVRLSFTVPTTGVTEYKVVYNTEHYPESIEDGTLVEGFVKGNTITGLTNDIIHYFTIFTINAKGRINGYNIEFTPTAIIPSVTNDVTVTIDNTNGDHIISWTKPNDADYCIVYGIAGKDNVPNEDNYEFKTNNISDTNGQYILNNLSLNTTYNVIVYSYNLKRHNISEIVTLETKGVRIVSFKDGNEQSIKDMLDAHYNGIIDVADYWNVGDEREIEISSEAYSYSIESDSIDNPYNQDSNTPSNISLGSMYPIIIRIIGFNHDILQTNINDKDKAAITVDFINPVSMSTYYGWGSKSEYYPYFRNGLKYFTYTESFRYIYHMRDIINCLPMYLQELVKTVKKFNYKTYSSADGNYEIIETYDKMFLLSYPEVFGTSKQFINKKYKGCDDGHINDEGFQYELFETNVKYAEKYRQGMNDKRDYESSELTEGWWLRSPNSENKCSFIYVDSSGDASVQNSYSQCKYIVPAFCL